MKSFGKIAKVLVAVLLVIAVGVTVMFLWKDAAADFLEYIFDGLGMDKPDDLLDRLRKGNEAAVILHLWV